MVPQQVFPAARGRPTSEQMDIPEGTAALEDQHQRRGEVRGKEQQREAAMYCPYPPPVPQHCLEWGAEEHGVKE